MREPHLISLRRHAGAGACAIVFSTTDRASFEALDKWKRKVEDEVGPGLPMVLVQNKIDLAVSPLCRAVRPSTRPGFAPHLQHEGEQAERLHVPCRIVLP